MSRAVLYCGDVRAVLASLPEASVQCVVTSPPYWGLRDYQTPAQVWGGDLSHAHEWVEHIQPARNGIVDGGMSGHTMNGRSATRRPKRSDFCPCGAWRGHLGLEPTPELYVEHMVDISRGIWRVLRNDGTLWLNLGDCYATDAGQVGRHPGGGRQGERFAGKSSAPGIGPMTQPNRMKIPGLKAKDLVMIPARVALALQAAGWYVRRDIIWNKPNPMPESIVDRPTSAHEFVYLLTKAERYYYDPDAIAEPSVRYMEARWDPGTNGLGGGDRKTGKSTRRFRKGSENGGPRFRGYTHPDEPLVATRNARSVWSIPTEPYAGAHFATMPQELARRCIVAGSSPHRCTACGTAYRRVLGEAEPAAGEGSGIAERKLADGTDSRLNTHLGRSIPWEPTTRATTGWVRGCGCDNADAEPCLVLDPFNGSGTTTAVAVGNGRNAIGIDLSPGNIDLAVERVGPAFCEVVG